MLAILYGMDSPTYVELDAPAIPIHENDALPGEWGMCGICYRKRMKLHLAPTSYAIPTIKGAVRHFLHCADQAACIGAALEKKRAAESYEN